jgi:hypothetical protein
MRRLEAPRNDHSRPASDSVTVFGELWEAPASSSPTRIEAGRASGSASGSTRSQVSRVPIVTAGGMAFITPCPPRGQPPTRNEPNSSKTRRPRSASLHRPRVGADGQNRWWDAAPQKQRPRPKGRRKWLRHLSRGPGNAKPALCRWRAINRGPWNLNGDQ